MDTKPGNYNTHTFSLLFGESIAPLIQEAFAEAVQASHSDQGLAIKTHLTPTQSIEGASGIMDVNILAPDILDKDTLADTFWMNCQRAAQDLGHGSCSIQTNSFGAKILTDKVAAPSVS